MPLGVTNLEANGFYSLPELAFGKSVQPAYRFVASFLQNPFKSKNSNTKDIGPMPVIMPWHVKSVNVPNYKFQINTIMYGSVPRLFSTLNMEGGLVFNVTFEEDELGTIAFFINWLQRHIIDREGYYNAPNDSRIGHFIIEVQDKNGIPVMYYVFRNIVFQDASDPTFEYGSNEVIRFDIRFSAEIIESWFVKYGAINKVQKIVEDIDFDGIT